MQLIIVSGRSGSGKTIALRVLEDLNFYCVDNLPISLLPALVHSVLDKFESIAVSIDVRNLPESEEELVETLDFLPAKLKADILFIDASDEVILRRFAETRRLHPLSQGTLPLPEAIKLEYKMLEPLATRATWRIDSSTCSVHELSEQVSERVLGKKTNKLILVFMSFGFKHGLPSTLDTVFDARILPNPHWEPELKPYSGLDEPVQRYLTHQPLVTKFIYQVENFLSTWLPHFQRSNRAYLTVGIGCTGGQHRSVYIAEKLAEYFRSQNTQVQVRHRELEKK